MERVDVTQDVDVSDIEVDVDVPDTEVMEDPCERVQRKTAAIRATYPLTMTKEECLRMFMNAPNYRLYLKDSKADCEEIDDGNAPSDNACWAAIQAGNPCPRCRGKMVAEPVRHVYRGKVTNFYFSENYLCECHKFRSFHLLVKKHLPLSLRMFALNSLQPNKLSRLTPDRQRAEIKFLNEHPNDGYFFLGEPGTSKSVFSAALYRRALARNQEWEDKRVRTCFYIDFNAFLEFEVAYSTANDKDEVERLVTPGLIRRCMNYARPTLCIEELDKRRITEFAAAQLFAILKALDDAQGQLIMTTNQTLDGFKAMFLESPLEQVRIDGGAILRRIIGTPGVHVRDFWK